MSNDTTTDTLGTIRSFDVDLAKINKFKAIQVAKEFLNMHHYYYHKRERIWKYILRSPDGNERIWYGRILKGTDRVCVVFGFNDLKIARKCSI